MRTVMQLPTVWLVCCSPAGIWPAVLAGRSQDRRWSVLKLGPWLAWLTSGEVLLETTAINIRYMWNVTAQLTYVRQYSVS